MVVTFYQLAIRYVLRKRSKTIVLFLVFLLLGIMLLSMFMILQTAETSKALIQEKTNAKLVLEIKNAKDKVTESEMQEIYSLDEVNFVNRQAYHFAFPENFSLFTNCSSIEEDNTKIMLFSYDDLKNDSAFSENRYRLIEGNYMEAETQNGAVINFFLAQLNGFQIGDVISIQNEQGVFVSVKIEGIFISGSERKQTDHTFSVNRIENQIFIDNVSYNKLFPNIGYDKAVVYSKNPEELENLEKNLTSICSEKVFITTSDTLFQQTKAPLEQMIYIVKLLFLLTFFTGIVIITILLCMWMRTRKMELAILLSMGKSKISLLLQIITEAFGILLFSLAGACVFSSFAARILENLFVNFQTIDIPFEISLNFQNVAFVTMIESIVVLAAVIFSIFPILKAKTRDILLKMEG